MEEEYPSRVPLKGGLHEASSMKGPTWKNRRRPEVCTGYPIECSGESCRSCTGGMIADCVALCCCPFAVASCFALAFLKAPWMIGRRCLGFGKKKRKCKSSPGGSGVNVDGNSRNGGTISGIENSFEDGEEGEAKRVWLELYQLDHFGFGRVSFSGIESQLLRKE